MALIDTIRDAINDAENNKLTLEEFDHLYRQLKKEAHAESEPLLAAGQKNHAANLNALLDGFHGLRPEVKEHAKEVHVKPAKKKADDDEKVDV